MDAAETQPGASLSKLPGRRSGARAPSFPVVLAFGVLLVSQAVGLVVQHPSWDVDDAAFHYRYAESLAGGHGYRFNVEEPPIWGASAPLWPLLLAIGVKLGATAEQAAQIWSWILTLSATALLGLVAFRLAGTVAVFALAPLVGVNFLYATFATSGMESPLGYALFAAGLAALCAPGRGFLIGVSAGLCIVHKVDLAPVGLAILGGAFLWRRGDAWRALATAALLVVAWYGFAIWHFGSPLPNSFVSKFHATYGDVDRTWFGRRLLAGAGAVRIALALAGTIAYRRRAYPVGVALVGVLAPLAGFTLHPPPEPFQWYVAAASPGLALLGALGLAWALQKIAPRASAARNALLLASLVALTALAAHLELPLLRERNAYLKRIEPPRIAAGRWIDANAPADARVLCGLGHVAFHARRFVYDQTSLNRKREPVDLLKIHRPEVVVRHTAPAAAPDGYSLVRRFGHRRSIYQNEVYVRTDLLIALLREGLERGGGTLPHLSQAARSLLARLPNDVPAGTRGRQDELLAELETWLRDVRERIARQSGADLDAPLVSAWLETITAQVAFLRGGPESETQ